MATPPPNNPSERTGSSHCPSLAPGGMTASLRRAVKSQPLFFSCDSDTIRFRTLVPMLFCQRLWKQDKTNGREFPKGGCREVDYCRCWTDSGPLLNISALFRDGHRLPLLLRNLTHFFSWQRIPEMGHLESLKLGFFDGVAAISACRCSVISVKKCYPLSTKARAKLTEVEAG